jgi:hypothetical protein
VEQAPLYHGRVKWQSLVNTKFNIRISENTGNTFTRYANIVLSMKTPAMQMFPLLCTWHSVTRQRIVSLKTYNSVQQFLVQSLLRFLLKKNCSVFLINIRSGSTLNYKSPLHFSYLATKIYRRIIVYYPSNNVVNVIKFNSCKTGFKMYIYTNTF